MFTNVAVSSKNKKYKVKQNITFFIIIIHDHYVRTFNLMTMLGTRMKKKKFFLSISILTNAIKDG